MNDLNVSMSLDGVYDRINSALWDLREGFHRSGRLDDSNAKLDEVAKFFATYLAFKTGAINKFPNAGDEDLIPILNSAFVATSKLPRYILADGTSIFGAQPALALRAGDEKLAVELITLIRECVDLAFDMRDIDQPFDILNEAFGHFIRDNFRGNIEDAQYMTPPEVVDLIADLAFFELEQEYLANPQPEKHWIVADPTCGVGSFLAAAYSRSKKSAWLDAKKLKLIGQDKVERMVRLSTINMELFDVEQHAVTLGNSLEQGSALDAFNGQVDLILTNPPFGARYPAEDIDSKCGENTPFFAKYRTSTGTIDSELLFIDRDLTLLRDGGHLFIVIPDGVVSAKGVAATLRQHLAGVATVKAVIELPATTFAQAGTRTKTSIVYLQKGRQQHPEQSAFLGIVTDLGFQVSSRKGVQVKVKEGTNQLPAVIAAYRAAATHSEKNDISVISSVPSCVIVPERTLLKGAWTANHYSARRFETVAGMKRNEAFELIPLGELVEFLGDARRSAPWQEGWAFVSILHVLGEGFLDMTGALKHAPKTPGVQTNPGELLLSRINPRIPRICVTPDFGVPTLCSSEFEVMRTKNPKDTYLLAYLIQTAAVQNQIQSLTSGTSASHNRIRTAELAQVLIPMPKPGSLTFDTVWQNVTEYEEALRHMEKGAKLISDIRAKEHQLFSGQN